MLTSVCEIPPVVRRNIEKFSDDGFWTRENLEAQFREDERSNQVFGQVLWLGFGGIISRNLSGLSQEVMDCFRHAISYDRLDCTDKVRATLMMRDAMIDLGGLSPEAVSARRFLTVAYEEECAIRQQLRMPFSESYLPVTTLFILGRDRVLAMRVYQAEHDGNLLEQGTSILREAFVE